MRTVAIIPARLESSRLPQKALQLLGGEPLCWRVYERAVSLNIFDQVYLATDSELVENVVKNQGGSVIRVDEPCRSGTMRVALAARRLALDPQDRVVNLQGDEPFVRREHVLSLLQEIEEPIEIATLSAPISESERASQSAVKVVANQAGHALYFSRAPIPGRLHLGIYGFTARMLEHLLTIPRGALATAEDLEQLDWLDAGLNMGVAQVQESTIGINTPAELEAAERYFQAHFQQRTGIAR